jgi:hypothetical protein
MHSEREQTLGGALPVNTTVFGGRKRGKRVDSFIL